MAARDVSTIVHALKTGPYASLSGRAEAENKTGFRYTQMSTYLRRHPALSSNEVRVLDVLIEYAHDYRQLHKDQPSLVQRRVTIELMSRELMVAQRTVERALKSLETFGLIEVHADAEDGRRNRYRLLPGPWPLLGDVPRKHFCWKDQLGGVAMARDWRKMVLHGDVNADNVFDKLQAFLFERQIMVFKTPVNDEGNEMLNKPKRKREERQAQRQERKAEKIPDSGDGYLPDSDPLNTDMHSAFQKAENALPNDENPDSDPAAPRARAEVNNKDTKDTKGKKQRAADGDLPVRPEAQYSDRDTLNAKNLRARSAYRQRHIPSYEKDEKNEKDEKVPPLLRSLKDEIEAMEPKREPNPVSACLGLYRKLLYERFDQVTKDYGPNRRKPLSQQIEMHGREAVAGTIQVVFDNWEFFRKKLRLSGEPHPPLVLFISDGWMEQLVAHGRAGHVVGKTLDWNQDTNDMVAEQERQGGPKHQDDLLALLDGLDA